VTLAGVLALHLVSTAIVSALFVWQFGHLAVAATAHALLVAAGDVALVSALAAAVALGVQGQGTARLAMLLAVVPLLQIYLYLLHAFSNSLWGRNITVFIVQAYWPTVLAGIEPLPYGRTGLFVMLLAGAVVATGLAIKWRGPVARDLEWLAGNDGPLGRLPGRLRGTCLAVVSALVTGVVAAILSWGIASDWAVWNTEMIASFFRPHVVIFEPTERRRAVGDRDAVVAANYPREAAGSRRNVVMIVADSLRADRMGAYGYERPTTPFLSSLLVAGAMQRVDVALSTCSESFCGVTSTLSSREFRDVTPRAFKLNDALRLQGYETRFVLASDDRRWMGLAGFYATDATSVSDPSNTPGYAVHDDRLILSGLDALPPAAGRPPAFIYIHLMSTHATGVQLDGHRRYGHLDDGVKPVLTPRDLFHSHITPNRYDDRVLQADDMVRQIYEALSRKGYMENALVVLTGDHGEGLGERHYGHGFYLYQEDIRIPLLIGDTAGAGYRNLRFATQLDIAPTILDRLGLPVPETWQGRSLLALPAARDTVHQTVVSPLRFSLIRQTDDRLLQLIVNPDGGEELYDWTADPQQSRNLIGGAEAGQADSMREQLKAYRAGGS
jgi:hypothetical protein